MRPHERSCSAPARQHGRWRRAITSSIMDLDNDSSPSHSLVRRRTCRRLRLRLPHQRSVPLSGRVRMRTSRGPAHCPRHRRRLAATPVCRRPRLRRTAAPRWTGGLTCLLPPASRSAGAHAAGSWSARRSDRRLDCIPRGGRRRAAGAGSARAEWFLHQRRTTPRPRVQGRQPASDDRHYPMIATTR